MKLDHSHSNSKRHRWGAIAAIAGLCTCVDLALGGTDEPKTREFLFTYEATAKDLELGQAARIWLPVPPNNEDQDVTIERLPAGVRIDKEPKYGNLILSATPKADKSGSTSLSVTYRVRRREVQADLEGDGPDLTPTELFLKADAKVPVGGKPLMLLKGRRLPDDQYETARMLYELVNLHMRYSKEGTGWGQGDAEWACDSKYGNCSDFHSLFISLARAQRIPAKFEMGFPLPEKRGQGEIAGYHCWAKFKPAGRGWVPVDISEANKNPKMKEYYFGNLTEDRVTFSVGRDIVLVPKQDGPPLNFFIYPYVEVDGKPCPPEKIARKFSYADVPTKSE
ncbi:MAG: transglutaminase domain-containing protein [Planctomycetes bacterium]|nr:transglutaminase domain-containing protein [Planctomycetota bacterium]